MTDAEAYMKRRLDGTFMKYFSAHAEHKWPFSLVPVPLDYIPDYCAETYTEKARAHGQRNGLRGVTGPRKRGGPPQRMPTKREINLIRQHEADGISQLKTKTQLGVGSETWARFRALAGFPTKKRETNNA